METIIKEIRARVAILVGKIISLISNKLHVGGGTAAPGLFALKIDPDLLSYYVKKIRNGSIVVSGTNGKTTTTRIISQFFSYIDVSVVHNRAGSNLERGLVSTLLQNTTYTGTLKNTSYGLWEIDEAEFSRSLEKIKPNTVILLNLFRDQLDRYGEVDNTRKKWEKALQNLPHGAKIIFNGDDPQLVHLIKTVSAKRKDLEVLAYGFEGGDLLQTDSLLTPLRLVLCPNCHNKLTLIKETIAGQGRFRCDKCGFSNVTYTAIIHPTSVSMSSVKSLIRIKNEHFEFESNLSGTFNQYNVIAAITAINELGYKKDQIISALHSIKSAFGRLEVIKFKDKTLVLCLIKNPAGATEILRTIFHKDFHSELVAFLLNDNFADGKDVSWIWDISFPENIISVHNLMVSGTRAYDMALRLEHEGTEQKRILVKETIESLFDSISKAETTSTIPVFATYTAMLEMQRYLAKNSVKKEYWEE